MRLGRVRITEANVDLTPMVDVVLLLVVFFMLTTQFARTQQTVVDLPEEQGEKARLPAGPSMTIDLTADGRIMAMGVPVDLHTLALEVERERASAGNIDIIVRADRSASSHYLNTLADTLARAGVRNWELATAGSGAGGEPLP
jgi:biopolymer transport protein ExbD